MKALRRIIFLSATLVFGLAQAKEMTFVGQEYPPFNWQEGNQVKGGMVDVLKKACEKMKMQCKFEIAPLPRALKQMESGEIDGVMSLIFPNAEREAYSNPSPTIIASKSVYMAEKGKHAKLKDLSELNGWTVGAQRASSSLKLAMKHKDEKAKGMTIVEENTNEDLVKKLGLSRYGDKGAIIGSEDVLNYFAKKNNSNVEPIYELDTQRFAVALSKKKVDAATQKAVFNTLSEMKKSGEMQKILDQYSLKTE